jgi:hypothetical protein
VTGVAGNSSRKFKSIESALDYFNENLAMGVVEIV